MDERGDARSQDAVQERGNAHLRLEGVSLKASSSTDPDPHPSVPPLAPDPAVDDKPMGGGSGGGHGFLERGGRAGGRDQGGRTADVEEIGSDVERAREREREREEIGVMLKKIVAENSTKEAQQKVGVRVLGVRACMCVLERVGETERDYVCSALSVICMHTHIRAYIHTHIRAHARTHTHARARALALFPAPSLAMINPFIILNSSKRLLTIPRRIFSRPSKV